MHLCNVPEKSQIAATVPSRGKRPISCSLILPRSEPILIQTDHRPLNTASPGSWYHLITHSFLRCFGHTTSNYNKTYKTRSFTSYRDQQETVRRFYYCSRTFVSWVLRPGHDAYPLSTCRHRYIFTRTLHAIWCSALSFKTLH